MRLQVSSSPKIKKPQKPCADTRAKPDSATSTPCQSRRVVPSRNARAAAEKLIQHSLKEKDKPTSDVSDGGESMSFNGEDESSSSGSEDSSEKSDKEQKRKSPINRTSPKSANSNNRQELPQGNNEQNTSKTENKQQSERKHINTSTQ
ncbi:uncharacterized protein LOC127749396 [Frankliniella occidentalis]|uniref:Uncharacterized protein LOC127749396 n=1 Tax=Frankliniella occidentalis TaxID=133901 RepID=A0A9C6U5H6_FRAOC|nr:uncharacterized protein LOC127749396 [Frankliniella occidentalis]